MVSERLAYRPVSSALIADFHRLVQDDHVRRYLMDGTVFPLAWSEERVRESAHLFERRHVGLWLAYERTSHALVGFCGFLEIPSLHPEPQIVYALFERFTGRGYATEMARASIAEARRHPGFATIVGAVDAVNTASLHVLDKLGFRRVATHPGAFGEQFVLLLDPPDDTSPPE